MSNALSTLTAKLAARLDMGDDGRELVDTLKMTAFRGDVSDAQMTALMVVANQYGLNPWTKEIYAFPDKNNGIVPVVGVDGWARIINSHPQFDGMEFQQSDVMLKMAGAKSEAPEWIECVMHRKDRRNPIVIREYLDEVYREPFKGKYGDVTGPWQTHPKRFLRHKAMIQCARMAFGFGGIYDHDEAERIVESKSERFMGAADEIKPAARALPASRADKARAALAQRKAAAAVTIEAALDAIHQASTPEALRAAGDLAAQLVSDDEKGIARDAYATRKAQLLTTPKVDANTGELLQPAFPAMQPEPAVAADPMAEHADFLADMA